MIFHKAKPWLRWKYARVTMLLAVAMPTACFAVGPDSCWLEGHAKGKTVKLDYVDDSAYGLASHRTYGYCRMGTKDASTWFMRCSATPDGAMTVYYETLNKGKDAGERYVCRRGCRKDVVKTFKLDCETGC